MAGSSGRLGRFMRSSVGALLTPAANPREVVPSDPERRSIALLTSVQEAVRTVQASVERLEQQRSTLTARAGESEAEARRAVLERRDDLARMALQRQRMAGEETARLDRQLADLRREFDRLTLVEQRITCDIEAMRARQQLAAVRHSAARAQVAASETLSGAGIDPRAREIERLETETEDLELRAQAIEGLIANGVLGASTGRDAPGGDDDLERQLTELKQALASEPRTERSRS